jgi:motility quorum-sensing regulator/GCU-specific mRNA interferase toxin
MEKRKAHYDLEKVKAEVLKRGMDAFTRTAKDNARNLGLDEVATLAVVMGLQSQMLLKSMTSNADHHVWQDVYLAPYSDEKIAYIKVTLQAGATVIQFKEK